MRSVSLVVQGGLPATMWNCALGKLACEAVLVWCSAISAVATAQPHDRDASVSRPLADVRQIEEAVQKEIDAGLFPGAVVLMGRPGRVLYHEAFGYARLVPDKAKMRKDSIFGLASITKVVATGIAFGICVDEGLLDFEMPICQALPDLTDAG